MASNSRYSKVELLVMYKECLYNHAAKAMGYVLDGCGQFVPNGPNGTPEAMVCAGCECLRGFHRRTEMELPTSYVVPENEILPQQNDGVSIPTSLPHPQPQPPQTHNYQHTTSHAGTFAPATTTRRNQIRQPEGLRLSTSPLPSTQSPSRTQSEDTNQSRGPTHRLPRVSQVPVDRYPGGRIMEEGFSMQRTRITRKQSKALRRIVERNNWKMFRHYTKEEIDHICWLIEINRTTMKNWINRHRRRAVADAAAAEPLAADPAAAAAPVADPVIEETSSSSEFDHEDSE